jgi:hypothetical protein
VYANLARAHIAAGAYDEAEQLFLKVGRYLLVAALVIVRFGLGNI